MVSDLPKIILTQAKQAMLKEDISAKVSDLLQTSCISLRLKAFDSIIRNYLQKCLKTFDFGPQLW